jgi:uncharacterized membrane protein
LIGVLFEQRLVELVGLDDGDVQVFRNGLLANSAEVMLLVSLLVLLYFDQRRSAALVGCLFLVCNASLTFLTVQLGHEWYGSGYLAASLVGLALAQWLTWRHVGELEYRTFTHEARRLDRQRSHRAVQVTRQAKGL